MSPVTSLDSGFLAMAISAISTARPAVAASDANGAGVDEFHFHSPLPGPTTAGSVPHQTSPPPHNRLWIQQSHRQQLTRDQLYSNITQLLLQLIFKQETIQMELNGLELSVRDVVIILVYGIIVIVSLCGNLAVCKVILCRQAMRRRITNVFIVNLTISDLLMTIFTIPMNTARTILDNWPFGELSCMLVPFVQALSVYVSSLSMTMIAIDRYQALVKPLKNRVSNRLPKSVLIGCIWILGALLSVPHGAFNRVVDVMKQHKYAGLELYRCKVVYPVNDERFYQQVITLLAFSTQFCIPLLIVGCCYMLIGRMISKRSCIGETTAEQAQTQLNSKRKTIKMLVFVVAVFAICWLPFNVMFIIEDFTNISFSLNAHYAVHSLAMSSICYNPFIYFWLNKGYRQEIMNIFSWCLSKPRSRRLGTDRSNRVLHPNFSNSISSEQPAPSRVDQQMNECNNNGHLFRNRTNLRKKFIEPNDASCFSVDNNTVLTSMEPVNKSDSPPELNSKKESSFKFNEPNGIVIAKFLTKPDSSCSEWKSGPQPQCEELLELIDCVRERNCSDEEMTTATAVRNVDKLHDREAEMCC